MIQENHRHVIHHTANILVMAFAAGCVAAAGFVFLAELVYERGGFITMLVVFSGLMLFPAGSAYKRVAVEKATKSNRCVVCHE